MPFDLEIAFGAEIKKKTVSILYCVYMHMYVHITIYIHLSLHIPVFPYEYTYAYTDLMCTYTYFCIYYTTLYTIYYTQGLVLPKFILVIPKLRIACDHRYVCIS